MGLFKTSETIFDEFDALTKRFDNMFTTSHTILTLTESGLGTPVDTAEETETGYRFTINAAGFKKSDLDIQAEGKVITVKGTSAKFKNKIDHYFTASKYIDTSAIVAKLEDGVLEIEVPFLRQTNTATKIEIK